MEIYDTEEEQVAAIKRWWKENGVSTIMGIVVGGLVIIGWNYWQSSQEDKAHEASAMYSELQKSIELEDYDASDKISAVIAEKYGSTAYANYAALMQAKTKVLQSDLEGAKTLLEKLMKNADSVELKNIARIRLVKLLQATNENEKGLQLIAEADQTTTEGFSASYDELTGDLYVALERLGEARTAYKSAIRAGSTSPLLQFKLDDITATQVLNIQE